MDPKARAEFDEIRAIMHAAAVREAETERRFTKRHEEAMARMDKFELSLGGIRKLILTGGRLMLQLQREMKGLAAETKDLKRAQKLFFESQRNGGNEHKKS